MGRIRTVKPEFWTDEEMAAVSEPAQLLALALLNYADDEGYFNANPALIKASCFPLREPSMSLHGMLRELSVIGFIRLGESADGKHYGHIAKFAKHQRINRPTPSKIKSLEVRWDDSLSTHGGLTEDSVNTHGGLTEASLQEGKGKERKGGEEQRPQASFEINPTPEDLPPLQLARGLIEHLNIPFNASLLTQVAHCIQAKSRESGISFAEAHDYIRTKALRAKPAKWIFWFRDAQYDAPTVGARCGVNPYGEIERRAPGDLPVNWNPQNGRAAHGD